jgi:four helix bundle protein
VSESIRGFRDLIVWQKAMKLVVRVYELSRGFPKEELYVLTAQIRRAAVSVPSNISEGHARQGREFVYFLSIARGSLAELETQLQLAIELGYSSEDQVAHLLSLLDEVRRMCIALASKVRARRESSSPLAPQP